MNGLTLLAVLQASLWMAGGSAESAEEAVPYAVARQKLEQTGTPMLVMVTAKWCGACRQMETTVIPQIRRRGLLGRVAYTVVDLDREPKLGRALTDGGPIPQLVLYRKTPRGWLRRRLVGGQSPKSVEKMIRDALAAQASEGQGEKTGEKGAPGADGPSTATQTTAQRVSSTTPTAGRQ